MNGPRAPATPPNPDHAPTARLRSSDRKQAAISARLPGVRSAPPIPCSTRAAIGRPMLGATPQSTDATANHVVPMTKMRRRPKRSPSDPPSRISAARLSV